MSDRERNARQGSNLEHGQYRTGEIALDQDELGRGADTTIVTRDGVEVGKLHHRPGWYAGGDWTFSQKQDNMARQMKDMHNPIYHDAAPFKTPLEALRELARRRDCQQLRHDLPQEVRAIQKWHEALAEIAEGMGNLSLEMMGDKGVSGINDGKMRAIYLERFVGVARAALGYGEDQRPSSVRAGGSE